MLKIVGIAQCVHRLMQQRQITIDGGLFVFCDVDYYKGKKGDEKESTFNPETKRSSFIRSGREGRLSILPKR